jgi:hypothetical protein
MRVGSPRESYCRYIGRLIPSVNHEAAAPHEGKTVKLSLDRIGSHCCRFECLHAALFLSFLIARYFVVHCGVGGGAQQERVAHLPF